MLLHRIAPLLLLSMSLIACRSPEMAKVDPRSKQNLGTDSTQDGDVFSNPDFSSPTAPDDSGPYVVTPTPPDRGPGMGGGGGFESDTDILTPEPPPTMPTAFAKGEDVDPDAYDNKVMSDQPYETIYFAYDQSGIGDSERVKLDRVADYLMQNATYNLHVEGHCDERGSEEYNRSLGERRAIAARDYLVSRGIDGARLTTQSYGEEKPAISGTSEDSYSRNRRAELKLVTPRAAGR